MVFGFAYFYCTLGGQEGSWVKIYSIFSLTFFTGELKYLKWQLFCLQLHHRQNYFLFDDTSWLVISAFMTIDILLPAIESWPVSKFWKSCLEDRTLQCVTWILVQNNMHNYDNFWLVSVWYSARLCIFLYKTLKETFFISYSNSNSQHGDNWPYPICILQLGR